MLRLIYSLPAFVVLITAASAGAQASAPTPAPPSTPAATPPASPPAAGAPPQAAAPARATKPDAAPAPAAPPPANASAPAAAPASPGASDAAASQAGAPPSSGTAPASPAAAATDAAPATGAAPVTPAASAQGAPPAGPPAVAPGQPEPLGMGEQSGATVYGAAPPPTAAPPPGYGYGPPWPQASPPQCRRGYCGPDCRQRCGRHQYCSQYATCEALPDLGGQDHRGLLVRATMGYGFGALIASDADVREGSLAIGLGVDFGGALVENLIIRSRMRGMVSYFSDNAFGYNVLYSFGTVGVGMDYYIMPVNIYVGGTVSLAGIMRADENYVNRSKAGVGLDFDVGKEWWVGRRWGIGLALRVTYIDCAPANILTVSGIKPHDSRLRSVHVGLQFSATFN